MPLDDLAGESKNDEFSDAFAKFASPEAAPAADAGAGDGEPNPDAAGDGDGGDAGAAGADGGAGDSGDGLPAGEAGEAGAGDKEPAPVAEDTAATDALIERLGSLLKDAPAPTPTPTPAANAEPEAEIYNEEEKKFLSTYDNDWADVTKGEALKRRAEYRDLMGYVFSQVAQQLRPMFETVEVLSTRTHLSDLRAQVDDYDTVRDKVVGWVEEQPMYLQTAYKQVIQAGTAEEVAHLIESYRKATGDQAAPTPPAKKSGELSDDAKKAALSLAPVTTKRSSIPQADDPDDFDSAFARFAKAGQGK